MIMSDSNIDLLSLLCLSRLTNRPDNYGPLGNCHLFENHLKNTSLLVEKANSRIL